MFFKIKIFNGQTVHFSVWKWPNGKPWVPVFKNDLPFIRNSDFFSIVFCCEVSYIIRNLITSQRIVSPPSKFFVSQSSVSFIPKLHFFSCQNSFWDLHCFTFPDFVWNKTENEIVYGLLIIEKYKIMLNGCFKKIKSIYFIILILQCVS